ncbi:nitrite reductase small subunit NirD [Vibrio aquaticus]|uniref:Nitrite reductase small subunit NirD n=1 Tax=Vibrio aquaticus TaxID=2496559 RepID=A0A432D323_9VIBR|nr:nitrite reductase small subunit NirD [Vibrio aquaticus]RTZ18307.1 nitrite reductase small subunit NirD [Vibrio aquaticus]
MDIKEKVKVCDLSDLPPYQGRAAIISGEQVALFNVPNIGVYAVQNWDPIGKAHVMSRGIVGDVNGHLCVASPLYKQHFRLDNGECIERPENRLKCWKVDVESGAVVVS